MKTLPGVAIRIAVLLAFFSLVIFLLYLVFNLVKPDFYTPKPGKTPPLVSPSPEARFQCPQNPWVNCMPGPGPAREECSQEYLDWAAANCPNFEGVAY